MRFDFRSKPTPVEQDSTSTPSVLPNTTQSGRKIAIIGTAGRDKNRLMTAALWSAMCEDLMQRVSPDDHLISGGAAWADHLAVHAMLQGWVKSLELHFPAPISDESGFAGPARSAGSAANYYHQRFSQQIGINTLKQLTEVVRLPGVTTTTQPIAPGYGAMFARNKKVANACNSVIAYTFSEGDQPADGGTANTWNQISTTDKQHVALGSLLADHFDRTQKQPLAATVKAHYNTTTSRFSFRSRPR